MLLNGLLPKLQCAAGLLLASIHTALPLSLTATHSRQFLFPLPRLTPPELLLRNSICKVLDRNEFETKRSGVFAQGVLTAAKMFFVENAQEMRVEGTAITEHGKEDASEQSEP